MKTEKTRTNRNENKNKTTYKDYETSLKRKNNEIKTLKKFYYRRKIIEIISLRFMTSIITVLITKKT